MSTDKSGIRIKRVGPDEETAAMPAAEAPAAPGRRPAGTRARTSGAAASTATTPEPSTAAYESPPAYRAPSGTAREDGGGGWPERLGTPARRETKPFFLTSEFLLTLATIAALLIAGYLRDDSLNAWRTWLLVTVIATAYVLSRGIAKAGSSDRR